MRHKSLLPIPFAVALFALAACGSNHDNNNPPTTTPPAVSSQDALKTATPIKHVVVIYGENVSFDHYFATYPQATNMPGEPQFVPAANTQTDINTLAAKGLTGASNPNAGAASPNLVNATINGVATQPPKAPGNGVALSTTVQPLPFRLDRSQANTESQNHSYTPEQLGDDNGKMDATPLFTSAGSVLPGSTGEFASPAQVLGYFDGNTVTAAWNYAQNFAMSDNAWTDTFGPSTPGAIEVVSGQNNGVVIGANVVNGKTASGNVIPDGVGGVSLIGDLDPTTDVCSIAAEKATSNAQTGPTAMMSSKNIGDLLNAGNITWGGFMGGFNLATVNDNGTTGCARSTWSDVLGKAVPDYVQHHAWFQYYPSTANPTHQRPSSVAVIGSTDPQFDNTATPVHHQYDTDDFFAAVTAGNFPSVSFLKAPAVGDGHPGNSDPLDEQAFVTKVVNFLEQQPDWKNTAVIVAYDDSDGWYDHQRPTIVHSSFDTTLQTTAGNSANGATFQGADQFTAAGQCTDSGATQPNGINGGAVNGRCGPGTRTPFMLISPWAKKNYVDHTPISQASVVRFIEDNWLGSERLGSASFDATAGDIRGMLNTTGDTPTLFLDEQLGTKLASAPTSD